MARPLGSKKCEEARIDSLPQSWAVISGAGDTERVDVALRSLEENLVREADDLILLFTPPFDKTAARRRLHQGYPPGVRENGGQYTHGAAWVAMAFARQGDGDKAVSTFADAESDRARPRREGLRALQGRAVRRAAAMFTR